MLNYARYGSYYLHQMKNKEVIYLGLKVTVSINARAKLVQYLNPYWPSSGAKVEQASKNSWRDKKNLLQIPVQLPSGHWIGHIRQKTSSVFTRCVTWLIHWMFTSKIDHLKVWRYGLQSYQYFSKITTSTRSMCLWKKAHLTISVLVLQCLLRLLTILSHYMKTKKIFATIFSKVESLQQQKSFMIRSTEITTKFFWQKKTSPSYTRQ